MLALNGQMNGAVGMSGDVLRLAEQGSVL